MAWLTWVVEVACWVEDATICATAWAGLASGPADGLGTSGEQLDLPGRRGHLDLDLLEGERRVLDRLAAGLADLQGAPDGLGDLPGAPRGLLGRVRHPIDAGDGLGHGGGLLVDVRRLLARAGQELGAGGAELGDRLADGFDGPPEGVGRRAEGFLRLDAVGDLSTEPTITRLHFSYSA